jgi:hypothetical protein
MVLSALIVIIRQVFGLNLALGKLKMGFLGEKMSRTREKPKLSLPRDYLYDESIISQFYYNIWFRFK